MEKQIIGYKLKKDCQQYKEAAIKITNNSSLFKYARELHGYDFSTESQVKIDLEKAGVLTLWFEPVYEEEEYKYKVGDWVVVLPEDTYYHNCEQGCAQQIVNIDFNRSLPYRLRFSNKSCNDYFKIRLATLEEIKKAITKELPIGKYTAIIKDGKITIASKGEISVEEFNNFFSEYFKNTLAELGSWSVTLTDATIKIGCVEDITLAQARKLYNYTKTL